MMKNKYLVILIMCLAFTSKAFSVSGSIKNSPHNLTALRNGNICSFCHTPHGSITSTPTWNHSLSGTVYKIYQSSSLDAKVDQPTGASKLCLSCHDGTVALMHSPKGPKGSVFITPGTANIGTDLSDDHPISFIYSDLRNLLRNIIIYISYLKMKKILFISF